MAVEGADPNVHLPKEVRDKIKRGHELFEQNRAAKEAAEQEPPALGPQQPAQPTPEQAAPPVVQVTAEEPPPSVPPPASDQSTIDEQLKQAQHRFNTLQGRYRSDMDRANRSIEDLSIKLATAMEQISNLSAKILAPTPVNGDANKHLTTPIKVTSVTDEERRDFGDGFLDLVSRIANEVASGLVERKVADINTKTEALGTRLDQTTTHLKLSKDQRREAWMDKNVPDWQYTDNDPGFVKWLDQEDAYSGIKRIYILKKAMDDENYDRIKKVFGDYVNELGAVTPSSGTRTAQTPRVDLEAQVLPNGGGGRVDAIVPNAPEAPLDASAIKAYYDRKLRNPKSLTEAEITQWDARIARALATGNVRPTPRV